MSNQSEEERVDPSTCRHIMIPQEFKESDYPTVCPGGFIRSVCKFCGARMSEYKTPQELESL